MKRYPFKFLDAYTREDSDIFFGRSEEVAQLYEMVFQADLLLLYGASGTGKSSLIQCGLASRFQSHDWLALNIRRGGNINESLDRALQTAGGTTSDDAPDWLDDDMSVDSYVVAQLSPLARCLKAIYLRHFKPLYLIFDQFEELYILGDKAEEQAFIQTVRDILRVEQPVKIILSIREEYLGYLYEFERQVPELLRKKLRIEPMHFDKVQAIVRGVGSLPEGNIRLQAGEEEVIAERVFHKIRGQEKTLSIQLPYLQVFLDKFYLHCTGDDSRKADALFTLAKLEELGDLGDVLRNFLEEQVLHTARSLEEKPEMLWQLLSSFVTLEGTKEPLSVAELLHRLPEYQDKELRLNTFPLMTELLNHLPENTPTNTLAPVLEVFVQRRILRFSEQDQRYEIAHDSLAKQLHARRSDEEIALLEVQRLIRSQAAVKAEAREYFSGKQLAFMANFLPKLRLTNEERAWIRESERYGREMAAAAGRRQREELEATKKRLRVVRGLLLLAVVAVAVAGYYGYDANMQKRALKAKQDEAIAERYKAQQALEDKEVVEFQDIYQRAENILNNEVGNCPSLEMIQAIDRIGQKYSNNAVLQAKINTINKKISAKNCRTN